MPVPGTRRELREDERLALLRMLTAIPFAGSEELIAQAGTATAVETSVTDIDLEVDPSLPRAQVPGGPLPLLGGLVNEPSGDPLGSVQVWIEKGRLVGLEFGWGAGDMPLTFPEPEEIIDVWLYKRPGSA